MMTPKMANAGAFRWKAWIRTQGANVRKNLFPRAVQDAKDIIKRVFFTKNQLEFVMMRNGFFHRCQHDPGKEVENCGDNKGSSIAEVDE